MGKPGPKPMPPTERIARRIVVSGSGCWEWQGDRNTWGYGRLGVAGRLVLAHRVSYEAHIGPIPPGMYVLHRCDNPACCNPEHLFLGTLSDNVQDCIAKGRHRSLRGERNVHAKLTEDAVREIRKCIGTVTVSELARRFGVSRRAIRFAIKGETWACVSYD